MDEATLKTLRDYGALGALVCLLLYGFWRLWGELQTVRKDSDERAKKYQDQLDAAHVRHADELRKLTEIHTGAATRSVEIFAQTTDKTTQALQAVTNRLLDMADKD